MYCPWSAKWTPFWLKGTKIKRKDYIGRNPASTYRSIEIAESDLIERKLKEQAMHIEELCKHMEIEIGGSDLNREDIILLY